MTILILQDSEIVGARCAEVGPAGVRAAGAAGAAHRASYNPVQRYFPVDGLALPWLLGDKPCWWDGTKIWAEVESGAMTDGVRT
jgi:hypothetical protein